VKPWTTLGRAATPDGSWLELREHDGEYVIRADGYDLMTSRQHGSEDAMMRLACPSPAANACVLIGGLGMGYTLRATLDALPPTATVVVAELIPEVVEWNNGPLAELVGRPLDDPRVTARLGDVAAAIRGASRMFDVILLDVDNGPGALTQRTNGWLYSPAGLASMHAALRPGGALAVWAVSGDPTFERHLRAAGFEPSTHQVTAHGKRGKRHTVFVGRKTRGQRRPIRQPASGQRV
jgi:spermidine synthase